MSSGFFFFESRGVHTRITAHAAARVLVPIRMGALSGLFASDCTKILGRPLGPSFGQTSPGFRATGAENRGRSRFGARHAFVYMKSRSSGEIGRLLALTQRGRLAQIKCT